jgi:hypothetical protein
MKERQILFVVTLDTRRHIPLLVYLSEKVQDLQAFLTYIVVVTKYTYPNVNLLLRPA